VEGALVEEMWEPVVLLLLPLAVLMLQLTVVTVAVLGTLVSLLVEMLPASQQLLVYFQF
jgi:hypothetical protein